MAYVPFTAAQGKVDEFLDLISGMGIDLKAGSQTEGDALAMTQVIEIWRNKGPYPPDPRPLLRAALGFVDLAGKVLSARGSKDFIQLDAHLRQLASGSVIQNRFSPVTDAVANKMVELYFGALAMQFAQDVVLDDPDHSKGDNPDVMFTFRGQRWALAMKTLSSSNPQTIYDNIKKCSDQIQVSDADHGLVVVNSKNIVNHEVLWPLGNSPTLDAVAMNALLIQVNAVQDSLAVISNDDWLAALGPGRKAHTPVLFLAQSAFFGGDSVGGGYPMPLKMIIPHMEPYGDPFGAMKLRAALHHSMQGFI